MYVKSLPSRERGLKSTDVVETIISGQVAPFAGAWIEIDVISVQTDWDIGRSLRGSVD